MRIILGALLASLAVGTAGAEVVDVSAQGMHLKQVAEVKAPAAKVYDALTRIGDWWSSAHSFSGDARNMRLEPKVGGCWCERLPNGGELRHLEVIAVEPGKALRLYGSLGPMQFSGAAGNMNWTIAEKDGVSTVTFDYAAGGYFKGGFPAFAPGADFVVGDALKRFKAYAETGKPD